jgi:multidrug efflux system outer membrane protein
MTMPRFHAWLLSPVFLLSLSDCAVGPDYIPPHVDVPPAWHEMPVSKVTSVAKGQTDIWWEDFDDQQLTDLIEKALANNQNLAISAERIVEVRGLRESAFGSLFPQIGVGAEASRGDPGVSTDNNIISFYQGAFNASWEIDLFGGNRRKLEAEDAATGAVEAAYHDALLSLGAEVAREYTLLRQFQAQREVAQQTADIQRHLYEITEDHYKGGLVSTLDVAQADTLYKTTSARIPDFDRQITASSYRLSVLLGENPGGLAYIVSHSGPIPSAQKLPVLDAPADIMRQRPDVAEAERSLAAATALQGVAVSALYPKISLSALFGTQYGSLPVFKYAATHQVWNLGADITMPILNFGTLEGQINAADARQVQALHHYRQTVIEALADVETDLSNLSKESLRDQALEEAGKSADHAVEVARDRYRNGLSDFTAVLQAEQQHFAVQIDLIASQSTVTQDVIALHKALGDNPASYILDYHSPRKTPSAKGE